MILHQKGYVEKCYFISQNCPNNCFMIHFQFFIIQKRLQYNRRCNSQTKGENKGFFLIEKSSR